MYTRFKSQKSGLKVGINNITNSARSTRVVVSPPQTQSSPTTNDEALFLQLPASLTSSCSSSSSSTSISMTTGSVIVAENASSSSPNEEAIEVSACANGPTMLPLQSSSKKSKKSNTNQNAKTSSDKIKSNVKGGVEQASLPAPITTKKSSHNNKENKASQQEEPTDPISINYVKSLWEKYSKEIGTQNGPLMHTDDKSDQQYPHLNGFVAFDIEHWWAERSISFMINEKSSSSSTAPSTASITPPSTPVDVDVNINANTSSLFSLNESKSNRNKKYDFVISNHFISAAAASHKSLKFSNRNELFSITKTTNFNNNNLQFVF